MKNFVLLILITTNILLGCQKSCLNENDLNFLSDLSLELKDKNKSNLIVYKVDNCFYTNNDKIYKKLIESNTNCDETNKIVKEIDYVISATSYHEGEPKVNLDSIFEQYDIVHTAILKCEALSKFGRPVEELTNKEIYQLVDFVFSNYLKPYFVISPSSDYKFNEDTRTTILTERLINYSKGEYIGIYNDN